MPKKAALQASKTLYYIMDLPDWTTELWLTCTGSRGSIDTIVWRREGATISYNISFICSAGGILFCRSLLVSQVKAFRAFGRESGQASTRDVVVNSAIGSEKAFGCTNTSPNIYVLYTGIHFIPGILYI